MEHGVDKWLACCRAASAILLAYVKLSVLRPILVLLGSVMGSFGCATQVAGGTPRLGNSRQAV